MTLTDLFDNLYRPLRLRGKSPNTTRLYLDPRITDRGQKPCDVLPSIERKTPPPAA